VTAPHSDSPFLAACRAEPHDRTPVWFMRQAGRSLPEYRAIRGSGSILNAIADADLSTEITLQPVRRYGVDAAILFSDIVVPAHAVGFGVDVRPGVGPVIDRPFECRADLERLRPLEPETDTPYVLETVRQVVADGSVPLIGFAGGPFTVASYLIEGAPSRTYGRTKAMMLGDPELWNALMERLADMAIASLRSQIDCGASAIQLFDSWAGALSPPVYERCVLPFSRRVFEGVADTGVPRIHFGVGTGEILQGNLDPAVCLGPLDVVEAEVADVLRRNGDHPGHIFNLGHGVLPEIDPAVLAHIVDQVHAHTRGG
jgi:uroporphyrinogen decarboxylase